MYVCIAEDRRQKFHFCRCRLSWTSCLTSLIAKLKCREQWVSGTRSPLPKLPLVMGCENTTFWRYCKTVRSCSIGINHFWLDGLVGFFLCSVLGKTVYGWFDWSTFWTGLKPGWNGWKSICLIMLRDCSSHNDYSQELPRFNQKRLEKCSTEKG